MKRVLFVCTGNTCRSPMAEALLRHHGGDRFEVQSAGVFAYPGSDASVYAKEALAEKGISINHAAQQVNETLLDWADIVVTMTENHKHIVLGHYPSVEKKLNTLYGLTEGIGKDISDPFGGSLSIYKKTLDEMEKLVQTLLKKHSVG
ncbi:low molecular weight protein arginine phosphatase [Bacillus thuringiensis]|uniref:Low molecular weight protein arginine phosphatase n=6 Tax=Bacillus cereus group TaxID=86661 RepID=A0A9X7JD10_BACTU|nr:MULTISPECIES: low molecular weight protein arginine phosphatase [Bacillus]MED1157227.1 low molecular weight protein arginine phosphatase [Bacillus paranthracis]ACK95633.1 low molecular weight phosphotyrosine protein phosphatase family protein [Bacillus cereus G9842]AFQ17776.1 low molecular weight phosphotyrosine protein phosphatase [Bacillus thuringiensis HD-771]AFQ29158.1 low molecular weight phosphotyrosine protein phosphatase [Bacillus thuringiensis HD-789]AJH05039.1 low molecular weight